VPPPLPSQRQLRDATGNVVSSLSAVSSIGIKAARLTLDSRQVFSAYFNLS
jgi:hypothetical protein